MTDENLGEWKKVNDELNKLMNVKWQQEREIDGKEFEIRSRIGIQLKNELLPLHQQRQKITAMYTIQTKPLIEKKITIIRAGVEEELREITEKEYSTLAQKCQIKRRLHFLLYLLSKGEKYYETNKGKEAEEHERITNKICSLINSIDTTFICKHCNLKDDLAIRGIVRETALETQLCRECSLKQDPSIRKY